MCRSVPQMPVRSTLMSTSLMPMAGTGTWSSQTPTSGLFLTRAFMEEPRPRVLRNDDSRSNDADNTDNHPEDIEDGIRQVLFQDRTPGEQDGVQGVENPDEHERTARTKPAYQTEAGNSHEDAD